MAFSEDWRHMFTAQFTISVEVSGTKNGRAFSPSHLGKSFIKAARTCSKTLRSIPSGLSSVLSIKGMVGARKAAREIRSVP